MGSENAGMSNVKVLFVIVYDDDKWNKNRTGRKPKDSYAMLNSVGLDGP